MTEDDTSRFAVALERIGKVLGALYASHLGDLEQPIKAERLSRCGFSNTEIADMLGTTANSINVALHRVRRGSKKQKKGSKRKAKK